MKKIIYIANARMPTEKAHGIQIMKMCEAFSQQGIKTELVVPWRFNKIKENSFDYYQIKRIFKIKKLPSLDLIPLGLPKIGFWIQGFSFALSVFFYLLFKKTDIIYSRDPFSLLLLSFLNKNLVYEAHTFPSHFFWYKYFFKKIKGLITITEKLKEEFIRYGMSSEKILVAPDGVDLTEFQVSESKEGCRRKLNLPINKKIVLYTGHLYQWKGAQILAKAVKFLGEDILVIFVGGTKNDISRFKVENCKFKNILVIGQKPHSEIPFWLKAADILVLPNSGTEKISKYWTSPLKLFEYMASQKPIVASDLPSIREILYPPLIPTFKEGGNNRGGIGNAILVEPDNPKALAEGIEFVLKNPDLSAKISEQAYKDVKKYTWKKRAEKILNFLNFIN
ncbi:glycosyltransferase family 4 protein [bacterium]|nr:glycosyltransferase family 4 protein [bacterium]